ncbi:MAG TPA: hypothetical protein VF703_06340 [Pyrinomonadaceae bacterium]|jgi:hypothetical protein
MDRVTKTACGVLVGVALIVALGVPATAQKRDGKKQAGSRPKPQSTVAAAPPTAEQQAALYALEQLFESARKFEDKLLGLRTQAQVADLLWGYDEPRAGSWKTPFAPRPRLKLRGRSCLLPRHRSPRPPPRYPSCNVRF